MDKITKFVSDKLIYSASSYHSSSDLIPAGNLKLGSDGFMSKSMEAVHTHWLSVDLGTSTSILPPVGSPLFMTTIDSSAYLAYNNLCVQELGALVLRILSPVVGICGQEGVGKTNLARRVSEEISPQFQHSFYKTNFSNKIQRHDNSYRPCSLLNFACRSLKESSFHGSSDDAIKEIIGRRKVLIVVDGVDDVHDLKVIIKDASRFGPGSRVIVITQNRSLLSQCGVKHIYELECPKYEEALAFFSEFAFKQRTPLPGFEALSFRAVQVSNRLPLALKILGSFLCNKEKDEWVSTLRRLEASHDKTATEVLRYIGADDYAPRRPIKVDGHIGVDEANRFPFYRFALK